MALILYGSPRSRTLRVLWTAAELDLTYRHVPLAWDDPALKAPDFLKLNPAGSIPTIVDGDFALSESMAINLYLAKKYGRASAPPLYPDTLEDEAEVWRWSLWAQAHLEPWVQRDANAHLAVIRTGAGDAAAPVIQTALETLGRALSSQAWLVGDHFSVADLNVAGVLSPSRAAHLPLGDHPLVGAWLARCYARPAARTTRARFSG